MKLPIDTSAITFLVTMAPEPATEFGTGRLKTDENGEALYSVQLVALGEGGADLITVKVPGNPPSEIRQGSPVKVTGLVASPWTMENRSGVSFRASRIEAISGAASSRAS
jgi:hypothetical protein